jgi:hypothetical protein
VHEYVTVIVVEDEESIVLGLIEELESPNESINVIMLVGYLFSLSSRMICFLGGRSGVLSGSIFSIPGGVPLRLNIYSNSFSIYYSYLVGFEEMISISVEILSIYFYSRLNMPLNLVSRVE